MTFLLDFPSSRPGAVKCRWLVQVVEPRCRGTARDGFPVVSPMLLEMGLGSAFLVSSVMAPRGSVAQIRCLSPSAPTFCSEIKREVRHLYSPRVCRQAVLRGAANRALR